ncbi:hypothetical protein Tco_0825734 [Tanacetum coccineum]
MKTLFQLQDLWEYVESRFAVSDDDSRNKEHHKRDAKALFFIQQAVDESIFPRIAVATSSKQAWSILKTEFQVFKIILARVSAIVSQMRSYREKIADEVIVAKVLRSLTPKFDHVVAAIEESKDLSKFSFDELMGSLQAHEARITQSVVFEEEKAFQTKGESQFTCQRARGKGRGGFRG